MNKRHGKAVRLGRSIAVVLPKDWTRGNEIKPGDLLELAYNGAVRIRPKRAKRAGAEERAVDEKDDDENSSK